MAMMNFGLPPPPRPLAEPPPVGALIAGVIGGAVPSAGPGSEGSLGRNSRNSTTQGLEVGSREGILESREFTAAYQRGMRPGPIVLTQIIREPARSSLAGLIAEGQP
jgi:hypothetical protein